MDSNVQYNKINCILTANSTLDKGLKEKSQEDDATSTLMRIWRLNLNVLMKFMITEMWTLIIQLRSIGLRIESI